MLDFALCDNFFTQPNRNISGLFANNKSKMKHTKYKEGPGISSCGVSKKFEPFYGTNFIHFVRLVYGVFYPHPLVHSSLFSLFAFI